MLLPAALEQLQVRRVVIPPHPGLFSALGLLATDLVYYDSQSAYMVLTPDAAPRIAAIFDTMERKLRSRVRSGADDVMMRRSFDGRLLGQSWETPLVEVPEGPITEATVQRMIDLFHDEYERRYGNRFPVVPGAGRHLSRPAGGAGRQAPVRAPSLGPRRPARRPAADADTEGAPPGGPAVRRAGVRARDARPGDAHHRPGDHPRGTFDDVPLPRTAGPGRPAGRDLDPIRSREQ